MRNIFLICAGIAVFVGISFFLVQGNINVTKAFENVRHFVASVFFVDSTTPDMLHTKYANAKRGEKLKVLIVPGHDDEYSGTQFRGVRESDMTVELGEVLAALLAKDSRFDVTLSRTVSGYAPLFQEYFASQRQQVAEFMKNQIAMMDDVMKQGFMTKYAGVGHHGAPDEVAYRLYAINKWANDNAVDLVIHIHFNNYPHKNLSQPGTYNGFTIYVPEGQYSNAKGSEAIARSISTELSKEYRISNLPKENEGVVPDQELIAIGSHNSLDGAGMLIEYGYIYEPQFLTLQKRADSLSRLAVLTYQGVEDFFNPTQN